MRSVPRSLALALFAGVTATTAVAGQARIHTGVDTTLVTVGDRVTLTVRVEHGLDETVAWPDSLDLSPFEVLGARLIPLSSVGERAVSGAVFTLTVFELGELEIPSFGVSVLHPDGSRETLPTDRFGVEVVSVGTDESGDIREIRGPLSIPMSVLRIALGWILFMVLGAVLWAAFRRWRRGMSSALEVVPGPPPRPAHEVAFEALDRLGASPLLERGKVKEFHIEASDIVRRYVEARYRVRALEMTTWEILAGMERVSAPAELRDRLRTFLDQCDLVKFAKVRPDETSSRAVLALGRAFVDASVAWVPVEPEPSGAGERA